MTHKTDLLPCPFCGGPATWATTHHVACGNESCALGLSEFLCWAHQWNRRAAPAAEPHEMAEMAEIERLEKELRGEPVLQPQTKEQLGKRMNGLRMIAKDALRIARALAARPAVPDGAYLGMQPEWVAVPYANIWIDGWNACRAAMLRGAK